jgi:hypothetical protein
VTRADAVRQWVALCDRGGQTPEAYRALHPSFDLQNDYGGSHKPSGTTADGLMGSYCRAIREEPLCESRKSKYCTLIGAHTFCDGTFGYKASFEDDHSKMRRERFGERPSFSVVLCSPCFSWEFWNERLAKHRDNARSIIADGNAYMLGTATAPGRWNGYGGSWFTVRFQDGRVVETCDLWDQGIIPSEFREQLSDNATLESGRHAENEAAL